MHALLALIILASPATAFAQSTATADSASAAEEITAEPIIAIDAATGPEAQRPASIPSVFAPGARAPGIATNAARKLFSVDPVSEDALAETTGREQVNWLEAVTQNTAIIADNKVGDNSNTGNVVVSDSAFQNVSGISIVNFNTGNNSSINAGMSVNLQINYAQTAP